MSTSRTLPRSVRLGLAVGIALALLPGGSASAGPKSDNVRHGQAMKVAAQCPLPDDLHSFLVDGVAHDRSVWVSEAQEACDQLLAGL
jgi:hypothetical protein